MHFTEFRVGSEFVCGEGRYRCTDIGSRVVVAIRVDQAVIARHSDGETTTRTMPGSEAEAEGWFNGPPYAVAETVFDDYDFEGCEPV